MTASRTTTELSVRTATGRPAPLVAVRIVDPDMNDVPHDGRSTGEVVARAPWLTEGYFRSEVASAELWRGGWLHTGDVGQIAPDGTLRITDRLKDVIKSGGEWISSLTLEDIASTAPGVSEVAAVGVPDERWGERPVLVTVVSSEHKPDDAIRRLIAAAVERGALPKWAIPDRICRISALPRTSVGKIDKKKIRQMLTSGDIA
jgi:fatty-acyl-CoA synthase